MNRSAELIHSPYYSLTGRWFLQDGMRTEFPKKLIALGKAVALAYATCHTTSVNTGCFWRKFMIYFESAIKKGD